MIAGWSRPRHRFGPCSAAVRAVDEARHQVDGEQSLLRDLPGGWDVSIGNIVLDAAGRPECVAHGELEVADAPATYVCATCGAQALFGPAA